MNTMTPPTASPPTIAEGVCTVYFAYDVGQSIDLSAAARALAFDAAPQHAPDRSPAPSYFEFHPRPLRMTRATQSITIADRGTEPGVGITVFDFGAISIAYTIALAGPLAGLVPLAEALSSNAALLAESRRQVEALSRELGDALRAASISAIVEDYAVYRACFDSIAGHDAETIVRAHAPLFGAILRGDGTPLSNQQLDDALACRVSYAPGDAALIDWSAAFIIAEEARDVLAVLEYANVELMEMRHLDDRLDRDVDLAYDAVSRPLSWLSRLRGSRGALLRRIARLQMDGAVLFEEVNNALKLVGDQHLARVYRLASQRFHLTEWDGSITRKLDTLDSIYQKLADERATLRMEILEWIIIALIAFEVVMSFVR